MTGAISFEIQDILRVRTNRALIGFPTEGKLDHVDVACMVALPGDGDPLAYRPLAKLVSDGLAKPAEKADTRQCLAFRKHVLTEAGKIRRAELRALVGAEA